MSEEFTDGPPPPGHRLDCKLSLGGKFCTCDYHKRKVEELPVCPECSNPMPGPHSKTCHFGRIEEAEFKRLNIQLGPPPKKTKRQIIQDIRQKQDGTTWMVSVIGPDQTDGSAWYSERAGKSPLHAAWSYMKDPMEDNPGARILYEHPDETLIVVIDQAIAPSGKQWHVHLFCIENGELRRFPG